MSAQLNMQVGTLEALSTLCAWTDAIRKQVVDARAVGPIVRALDDPTPQVTDRVCARKP